jgi:predicted amidohydrolase YtcJ
LLSKFANSNGTSSLETTPCVSTKSSYVDATTYVDSKAPYEKQPSTMESQVHSRKTLVELVKETQKVHPIHVTNIEN